MGPGDSNFVCEARQFGERMHCGRCELHNIKPGDLVCKSVAECGLTASVIRAALEDSAVALAASIDAASRCSIAMNVGNGAPDARLLRREAALRAGVRLVERYQAEKGKPNG